LIGRRDLGSRSVLPLPLPYALSCSGIRIDGDFNTNREFAHYPQFRTGRGLSFSDAFPIRLPVCCLCLIIGMSQTEKDTASGKRCEDRQPNSALSARVIGEGDRGVLRDDVRVTMDEEGLRYGREVGSMDKRWGH
jgi:hypothetical protein